MSRQVINETIELTVANCPENKWRRDNLLHVSHVKDIGDFLQVVFSFVVNESNKIINTRLIYNIRK
jgi:hypothetical protein